MSATLTQRQAATLAFIKAHVDEKGFGPTYGDIGKALGTKSRSSVHRIVHSLVQRGCIRKRPKTVRDIQIIQETDAVYHLKALLAALEQNKLIFHDEQIVLAAKKFLGRGA